jgi:RHS repeat-associated protein
MKERPCATFAPSLPAGLAAPRLIRGPLLQAAALFSLTALTVTHAIAGHARMKTIRLAIAGVAAAIAALGVMPSARADYFEYDSGGGLVYAIQSDGTKAVYSYDSGRNVSTSASSQPGTAQVGQNYLLAVQVSPFTNPPSTGFVVKADVSALGGSANQILNDSGTNGDAVAGDGIYSALILIGSGATRGTNVIDVTHSDDQGRNGEDFVSVTVSNPVPSVPSWGVLLLVALLFGAVVRALPRRMIGVSAACAALAFSAMSASAQTDYPVWTNIPMDVSTPVPVIGFDTPSPQQEQTVFTESLSVPDSMDAEVTALATALGSGSATPGEDATAKAVRIFNWVHNNINFEHYYGLRKGSALTLLEGYGNDWDQSALLKDLLVAAGYPAANVKLRLCGHRVDYPHLMSWMGLAQEPFPGKTFQQVFGKTITQAFPNGQDQGVGDLVAKQAEFAAIFLGARGAAWSGGNGVPVWYPDFPSTGTVVFNRLWVQLTVNGTTYDLDPSYKAYQTITSANDLLTAAGYNRTSLLNTAGGTSDANSTYGLNQTNVQTYLTTLTTQLSGLISGTWQNLSVSDLVNGRQIVQQNITKLSDAFPLTKNFYGTDTTFNSTADAAFAGYKTTVRFQSGSMDYTMPTSDLKGRKITLTFSGNTAALALDDATPVATTTVTTGTMPLTITVTHPGSTGTWSETKTYQKNDSYAYAIVYGFTPSARLLQKRYDQLRAYLDAGKTDSSLQVRTELLNIMGLTWLYQTELSQRLLGAKNNVLHLNHHRFGRMSQEQGFYVDVGLQLSGDYPNDANPTDSGAAARFDNVFHLGALFASAMEHGIIEQMQPGSSAVSTVNILRKANSTSGNSLLLARSSNWSTVQGQLTNYTSQQKTDFGTMISQGAQLFLPKSPTVTQGNWTGSGWVIRSSTSAGMIISGGYSGGYSTAPSTVVAPPITTSYTSSPAATYTPPTTPTYVSVPPPPSTPQYYGSDPVDMATGGFTYSADDMATGVESVPRGLSFSRYYSSNEATRDSQHLGYGWSHSLYIHADSRTAAEDSMGQGTPQSAASFIVAVLGGADLYRSDASAKEWGVAALAVGWFVDGMKQDGVSIRIGKDVYQFIGQPDGTYTPPSGSTLSLTKATDGTYRLQQRLSNTIQFDSTGNATKIVDVDGKEVDFNYNADGTINYVQDSNSRRYNFLYSGGRISGITDSTGRSIGFAYDGNGNLTSKTDPESKSTYYDYTVAGDPGATTADQHRIVRLRNHDNETITQSVYDSLGRVAQQFLHGDTAKTFNLYYTGPDNYQVDPQGGVTHYYYDSRGRASGSLDADGNQTSIQYDAQDRVSTQTTATGESTVYHYDSANNVKQIDYPRGGGSAFMLYDGLNRLYQKNDSNGVETDYVYFTSGTDATKDRPQYVIGAKGTADQTTTTYQYIASGAAQGRVWKITDGDGLVTENAYDANGQLDWVKAPGGFLTDYNYTARGDLDYVIDPNNIKTKYTYNLRRQATNKTQDYGGSDVASEDTAYDNQGRVQTSTKPVDNGGQRVQTTLTYNPTNKVRLETLAGVTVANHAYDTRDWEGSVTDAASRQTTLIHYSSGAVKQALRPGARNSTFGYDADQRMTASLDPGANKGALSGSFTYTANNGLPRNVFTDNDGLSETSDFDHLGKLRFLKDKKGATFEFCYDNLGHQSQVIAPGLGAVQTSYMHDGRIALRTEPSGDSASYAYNPTTGRLTSVTYTKAGGSSSTVNYTSYDSDGRVLTLDENGSGGITRTYDHLGRVTSYTGPNGTIGYRYFPSGRLYKLIYPGGNDTTGHVEYSYTTDGRLYQVIDRLGGGTRTTTYAWRTDGLLSGITRPNGTTRTPSYDSAGRPEGITESLGGTAFLQYGLTYYPNDTLRSLTTTPQIPGAQLAPLPTASMGFNSANQLTSFNGSTVTNDPDGNMTFGPLPQTGGLMGTYVYDSRNRLTSAGGLTYTYDAEGNRIGIGGMETQSFLVDTVSDLPKVIQRTKNGVTTRYVYGAGLQYELNASNQPTYYHFDQVGNTAALTSASGAVVERIAYSPYGIVRYRQSNFDTPFLFNGHYGVMTDSNGLLNMRARYYNPLTCRFINSDPSQSGWNWYGYCSGDPVNFNDPFGLWTAKSVCWNVAKGVAIGAVITGVVVLAAPVAVSGLVALGLSATAATATVTTGLGAVAVIGGVVTAADTVVAVRNDDWDRVAYNVGTVAGGVAVSGAGGGRFIADNVSPSPSTVPRGGGLNGDRGYGFVRNPELPFGQDVWNWLGTGPTPQSGGGAATFISSGVGVGANAASGGTLSSPSGK